MVEHIIEREQRLSRSLLWKLQETAYQQFGIGAWSQQGVPSYITSNPYTAKCYAQVVAGFLGDMVDNGQMDPSYPVYILDLGAGSGRFAFLFLRELFSVLKSSRLFCLKIHYVMTDIVESNLVFWRQHPLLKPYFQNGVVDSAIFHHAQKIPMQLLGSGAILDEALLVNPMVAIANYFFDTIPQDLFRVQKGMLEEGRAILLAEGSTPLSTSDPTIINRLRCQYSYEPIVEENYYADPNMNAILEMYRKACAGSSFLFPIGALETIRRLRAWARGRLFFIAGDQGVCTLEQVRNWGEPKLSLHGSFSIAVSYHAIAAFVQQCGGQPLLATFSEPSFVVMAGMLTSKVEDVTYFSKTKEAFSTHIDSFEPRDYWRLVSIAQEDLGKLSLEYLLLLIKLGNWDPMTFHALFPALRRGIGNASACQKKQLAAVIDRVWEHFYAITPEEGDFVLNLGVLLFDLKDYEAAIRYFERSMEISGPNRRAMQNIAACRREIRD